MTASSSDLDARLNAFYAGTLEPELQSLDAERSDLLWRSATEGAIVLAVVAAAIFLLSAGASISPIVVIVLLAAAAAVWGWRTHSRLSAYRDGFKSRVIAKLVKYVDSHLTYTPDEFLGEEMFETSGLFTHKPDAYDGSDLVGGHLGATTIAFSEVHAQYRTTTTDGQGHLRTQWHTIFKGVLVVADFNKAFRGRTYVLPDTAERLFGSLGQALQGLNPDRDQLVKLENPDFERAFVVYASDQIEARYILTPSLMERILDYQRRTGAELRLGFVDSCVYVAIPEDRELFAPTILTSIVGINLVKDYLVRLELITSIVEEFNLNTRIWGKS